MVNSQSQDSELMLKTTETRSPQEGASSFPVHLRPLYLGIIPTIAVFITANPLAPLSSITIWFSIKCLKSWNTGRTEWQMWIKPIYFTYLPNNYRHCWKIRRVKKLCIPSSSNAWHRQKLLMFITKGRKVQRRVNEAYLVRSFGQVLGPKSPRCKA